MKKHHSLSTNMFTSKLRSLTSRYPLIVFAFILGLGMVTFSAVFAHKASKSSASAVGSFDTGRVLQQPVPTPAHTTTYTADSIMQYDGKDGHPCYVAVKGTVYEIKDNSYWKNGQHTPSGGRSYCGADMTSVIGQSPHGESVLSSLPKVGIFK